MKTELNKNITADPAFGIKRYHRFMAGIVNMLMPVDKNWVTLAKFCLMVFLIASPIATVIIGVTSYAMEAMGVYNRLWHYHLNNKYGFDFFGVVVFAPIFETLMLSVSIYFTSKFTSNRLVIAVLSGIVFGVSHGINGIYWFFGPTWLFFVFSYSYLFWRPHSYGYAFLAAGVPHMLNNLATMLIMFEIPR